MVITSDFQSDDRGSIPLTRSLIKKTDIVCSFLLERNAWESNGSNKYSYLQIFEIALLY